MGNFAQGLPDFLNSELHYSLRSFRPIFFPSFSRAQSCMVLEGSQSFLVLSSFSLTGTFPNKFPAYSSRFGFYFLENTPHDVLPPNQTFPTICLLPTPLCIHSLKIHSQEIWSDISYLGLLLPVTFAYWNIFICGIKLFGPDKETSDSQKPFWCPRD